MKEFIYKDETYVLMENKFAKNISWSMVLAVGLAEWFIPQVRD
ncbi:MAG: hypothetical protein WC868_09375 [Bacteroidales bacterium]